MTKYLQLLKLKFINSTLESKTFLNTGIDLEYCCPISRTEADLKFITIGLNVIANHSNDKTKTRIYGLSVPINRLNEIIMSSISNKIINYNKILGEYGYIVSLYSEVIWTKDNINMINCSRVSNGSLKKTLK